ncbi:MAG: serine/threonine protein kinase/formylglycine-generating enzyme required for sulfatase activity [Planctomycetota bacterium]|jgi:serine/threonine protein kinase/formylglycine-generating enzyme required for sulfatase activity
MTPQDKLSRQDSVATKLRAELGKTFLDDSLESVVELRRITDSYLVKYPHLADFVRTESAQFLAEEAVTGRVRPAPESQVEDLDATVVAGNAPQVIKNRPDLDEDDPKKLGRYIIQRRLGRGGMGVVFLADDPTMHRQVAVKMLPKGMVHDQDAKQRFQREAAAAADLSHPSIVPIYEVGSEGEIPFYAMRHVVGDSLREFATKALHPELRSTDRKAPSMESASFLRNAIGLIRTTARIRARVTVSAKGIEAILRIGEQTARGLAHAHSRGVIHRDVKPANIMVDRQGSAQLLDFGLAKIESRASMTKTGLMVGTVAYMAPEQISDELGAVDGRTDIYSLGVTLFECLAGCRPFRGATSEALMFQALNKAPPSPLIFVPELSRDIETIILKCLEKKPDRRYKNAIELAEDIARVRAHKRIEAQPIGVLGHLWRWAEYHRGLAAMSVAIFLILAAIPLLSWQRTIVRENQLQADFERENSIAKSAMNNYRSLSEELDIVEVDLTGRRKSTPEYLAATDSRKAKVLALESKRAELMRDRRKSALRAEFAHVRAREILGRPDAASEENYVDFLFAQYLEAEERRDEDSKQTLALRLENTNREGQLAGQGKLTLNSFPDRSRFAIRELRPQFDLRLEESAEIVASGTTPIINLELPCGRYIVEFEHDGRQTVRYPIFIERGEHWGHPSWHNRIFLNRNWLVVLPEKNAFENNEWAFVPAGPFLAIDNRDRGTRETSHSWRWVENFMMKRDELTGREFSEYMNDAAVLGKRKTEAPFDLIPHDPDGNLVAAYVEPSAVAGDPPQIKKSMMNAPIGGLSQRNASSYASWLSEKQKRKIELPTALQWEKAARGVDGRIYPWGDVFDAAFLRLYGRNGSEIILPSATNKNTKDRSPYGVRELSGGVREWCQDGHDLRDREVNPYLAGGNAVHGLLSSRSFMAHPREFMAYDNSTFDSGVRLVIPWETQKK